MGGEDHDPIFAASAKFYEAFAAFERMPGFRDLAWRHLAAVYGVVGALRNAGDLTCRPALDLARRVAPLASGKGKRPAIAFITQASGENQFE